MRKGIYENYIKRAMAIHGDKYNYSKADAATCKDKTTFICPIHGEFQQSWDNHINAQQGCPKCTKYHTYTNDEWIEEASKRHNGKYDYSKTVYTKANEKVTVICHEKDEFGEEHGEFLIRAGNHMYGIGCPKCTKKYRPTTEEWIKRANKVHNRKYDYSKVKYTKSSDKVIITCPIHGDFVQEAMSHLSGCGCPKCNGGVELEKEEYISKFRLIHGDKYEYRTSDFIAAKKKIDIICPVHGVFRQTPDQHLRGQGCPKCKSSKLENSIMRLLEKNKIKYTYQYKIQSDKVMWCDFLLDEYDIVIECQGEQHFTPMSFTSDKSEEKCLETYWNVVYSDINKYVHCVRNGKKVVYFTIPSYFSKKDIEIQTNFYKDKILFTDKKSLINFINNTIKNNEKERNFR